MGGHWCAVQRRLFPNFCQLSLRPTNNAILYVETMLWAMLWAMLCSHLFIFFAGSKLWPFFGFQIELFKIVNLKLTLFQKYHLLMRFSVSQFYFCTSEGTKSSFISHGTLQHLPLSKFSKILNLCSIFGTSSTDSSQAGS